MTPSYRLILRATNKECASRQVRPFDRNWPRAALILVGSQATGYGEPIHGYRSPTVGNRHLGVGLRENPTTLKCVLLT
jgi:hypothetical protein